MLHADVLMQAGHGEMSRLRADLAEVLAQKLSMQQSRCFPVTSDASTNERHRS